MQCPCGGETQHIAARYTKLKNARQWNEALAESDLPYLVAFERCKACGREGVHRHIRRHKPQGLYAVFAD